MCRLSPRITGDILMGNLDVLYEHTSAGFIFPAVHNVLDYIAIDDCILCLI